MSRQGSRTDLTSLRISVKFHSDNIGQESGARNKSSSMRRLPYRQIAENIFAKSRGFLELDALIRYNMIIL